MGKHLNSKDLEFIKNHVGEYTDQAMANMLGCHINTVRSNRRKMNLKKENIRNTDLVLDTSQLNIKMIGGENEIIMWRDKITNSAKGNKIKEILSQVNDDSEWLMFVDEWISFHIQFEDLTHTEEQNIEHIIFLRLIILNNQKDLSHWKAQRKLLGNINISKLDFNENPDDAMLYSKLNAIDSKIGDLNKEYKDMLDKANQLYRSLSGTREQREKKGQISSESFFGLCEQFKEQNVREREGRMAELLRMATEKKASELRESIEFADGELAPQLLDVDTVRLMKEKSEKENS